MKGHDISAAFAFVVIFATSVSAVPHNKVQAVSYDDIIKAIGKASEDLAPVVQLAYGNVQSILDRYENSEDAVDEVIEAATAAEEKCNAIVLNATSVINPALPLTEVAILVSDTLGQVKAEIIQAATNIEIIVEKRVPGASSQVHKTVIQFHVNLTKVLQPLVDLLNPLLPAPRR